MKHQRVAFTGSHDRVVQGSLSATMRRRDNPRAALSLSNRSEDCRGVETNVTG